ncbi:Organic cation transporter-like protein [Eumeta japonica]|uniref:Organic cation transporter-like protein n=1 Tax=Eumeta variegata TaxID=151549 RepID=A0A4C1ZPV9_EUMVA|nr:Organic cation transporter-like protein [Eumeta japonica]
MLVSEKTKVLNEDCDSTVDFTSSVIGDFGKWQLRMSVMMSLLRFPVAWFLLEIIFLAPPQRFWCQKPESFEVYSDAEWREICCPVKPCHYYLNENILFDNNTLFILQKRNNPCVIYDPDVLKNDPDFDRRFMPVVDCPKFVYDKQVFNSTITSEWDLVCSRFWLVHLSQCSMMCGVLLGGVVFGGMADKHGRKNLLMICIAIQAVTSFVLAAVFAFWQFLLVRFILALASGGIDIQQQLEKDVLDIALCRAQGYDKPRQCQVSMEGCNEKSENVTCFGTVEKLYSFFSSSTQKWQLLKEKTGKKLKRLSDIRWSAHYKSVTVVKENIETIVSSLEHFQDPTKANLRVDTKSGANLLLPAVCDFTFLTYIQFWFSILKEVNLVQQYLQSPKMTLDTGIIKLNTLNEYLVTERTTIVDNVVTFGIKKSNDMDINVEKQGRRKVKRTMPDESAHDAGLSIKKNNVGQCMNA